MQGIEARRAAGSIANGYQRGCVSTWDIVGISYSVFVLVKEIWDREKKQSHAYYGMAQII